MVSRGIVNGKSSFQLIKSTDGTPSVAVEMLDDMKTSSRNSAPKRFGRPSRTLDKNGFSDHYPITMWLKEK